MIILQAQLSTTYFYKHFVFTTIITSQLGPKQGEVSKKGLGRTHTACHARLDRNTVSHLRPAGCKFVVHGAVHALHSARLEAGAHTGPHQ